MGAYGLTDDQVKNQGQALQQNQLLQGIVKEMRDTAFTQWVATSPADAVVREQAWYAYKAVEELQTMIDNAVVLAAGTGPKEI